MSKEYNVTWICDRCGQRIESGEAGFPPDWLDLSRGDVLEDNDWQDWDFCSWQCLSRFADEKRG